MACQNRQQWRQEQELQQEQEQLQDRRQPEQHQEKEAQSQLEAMRCEGLETSRNHEHDVGKPKCLVPLCHSDIMEIGTDDPSHCPEVAAPGSSSTAAAAALIR